MSNIIVNNKSLIQTPVVLTWLESKLEKKEGGIKERSYSYVYYNCATGTKGDSVEEVVNTALPFLRIEKASKVLGGYSIQYDEDIDMLAVIYATFNAKKIKEPGETRYWEEQERFYVDRDKNVYLQYGRSYSCSEYFKLSKVTQNCFPFNIDKLMDIRSDCTTGKSMSIEEIYKLFPKSVSIEGNKLVYMNSEYRFLWFLSYKEPVKKAGPKQKRVDELTAIKLPELKVCDDDFRHETMRFEDAVKFCRIEKVPTSRENICVLRTFHAIQETKEVIEGARFYIGAKECIGCKIDNKGGYIQASLCNNAYNWNFRLQSIEEDAAKGTKLEYCLDIINEFEDDIKGVAIMSFSQWPVLEMLYKIGQKKLVIDAIKRGKHTSPIKELEREFGKLGTGKNLNKILGLNKKQMEIAFANIDFNNYRCETAPIVIVKNIVGGFFCKAYWGRSKNSKGPTYVSLSDLDDNSFETLFKLAKELQPKRFGGNSDKYTKTCGVPIIVNCLVMIGMMYGLKVAVNMVDDVLEIAEKGYRKQERYNYRTSSYIMMYRDYLDMVEQLKLSNRFKPYFDEPEDIIDMHDELSTLFDNYKVQANALKFEERKNVWKKFLYEDSNYSVIMPDKPEDIAEEGLTLRHCVKSYIQRVTDGTTNILFIRKAEEIGKPFFTVEISDKGRIEQIHGFGNRNVDSEPDLIYFVKDWIEAKKLQEHSYNKIR